ncbi:MAG: hypothetical protein WBA74_07835 [Cyclobacteriaceae bacterium]
MSGVNAAFSIDLVSTHITYGEKYMLKDLEAILHGRLPEIRLDRNKLIITERHPSEYDEELEQSSDLCDLFQEREGGNP